MFACMTSISGTKLHAMFLARAAAHRATGSGLLAFQDIIEAMKVHISAYVPLNCLGSVQCQVASRCSQYACDLRMSGIGLPIVTYKGSQVRP